MTSETQTKITIRPTEEITSMSLIQTAVLQGSPIETIERLVKLQREQIEYQAKVEWQNAMHRCQEKMKPIGADMQNPQTRSKYASYEKLDRNLRPIYSTEGFSLSFNTSESPLESHIRVLCDVSNGGHTKIYQVDMPADGKGAKGGDVMTKTHAAGSAMSYGMRYLLKMIFNVAIGEQDDDGNLTPPGKEMDLKEFARLNENIESAENSDILMKAFSEAWKTAKEISDKAAQESFRKAKDKRKQELGL